MKRLLCIIFFIPFFSYAEVVGLADLHTHMFADEAFGGAWVVGTHKGEDRKSALPLCLGHRMTLGQRYIFRRHGFMKAYMSFRRCVPRDLPWPNWSSLSHHQVWAGALKKAWRDGLRLIIISAVNNEDVCKVLGRRRRRWPCDNHTNILRQLDAFHRFDQENKWIELATTPQEAREIINRGNLAAILSIEVSRLFENMAIDEALDLYTAMGVRSFQPVHQLDNRFAGSARHMRIPNRYNRWFGLQGLNTETIKVETPFDTRYIVVNKNGMTAEGEELIQTLVRRRLLIDLSHMSEKSIDDISSLAKVLSYPVFISHGHIRSTIKPPMGHFEKTISDQLALQVKNTGGMIGLRTGPEAQYTYEKSNVKNDCPGSVKSFAQGYAYAVKELKIPVALATDFNGFIQQVKPRFGRVACQDQKRGTNSEFDTSGLGHMGLVGEFIKDLEHVGADTKPLFQSAEKFIQMWEKIDP